MENQIEIYKSSDNQTQVEVKFDGETVWLNRQQLSLLFDRDVKTIGKHINNVFSEGELEQTSTVANFATVENEGGRIIQREIEHYNLDVIISVGYRVKSQRGVQFRQWATQRLKEYLVRGYAINQKRLDELGKMVQLIEQGSKTGNLHLPEAKGLLDILSNYTKSFVLLNQFDSNQLPVEKLNEKITYEISYPEARDAIDEMKRQLMKRKEATQLFGNEKDEGFKSSLQSIAQTFDERYLYPSIEEQAAHLLYFIIKNHSFTDGNKRIGAFLFIWFLEKNKHRFKKSGEVKINDNGLTALSLLVAQSVQEEKDLMIKLVINLIKDK